MRFNMYTILRLFVIQIIIGLLLASGLMADQVALSGFAQGLFGGKLQQHKLTPSDYSASEFRLQMRLEAHAGDADFFSKVDFVQDNVTEPKSQWELREAYLKYTLFKRLDFKVGRQILTWGTGDLIFINDLFAKDYESFFSGRDDEYLKAPQTAIRSELYTKAGTLSLVWTPRFTPNRIPNGDRFSYYNPMVGDLVGGPPFFSAPLPAERWENSELAARFQKGLGKVTLELYGYRGFYKNPVGFDPIQMLPYYPKLSAYGTSLRGQLAGGIGWIEGGYYDSREDRNGTNPMIPNSSILCLAGFERQVATDLTANLQYQAEYMEHYKDYEKTLVGPDKRDRVRSLITSRITRNFRMETIQLSSFVFWSPSDQDVYYRFALVYKYNDAVTLTAGGNVFDGKKKFTDFGAFALNDNLYAKMTYGF
jgi:hypothetical protein